MQNGEKLVRFISENLAERAAARKAEGYFNQLRNSDDCQNGWLQAELLSACLRSNSPEFFLFSEYSLPSIEDERNVLTSTTLEALQQLQRSRPQKPLIELLFDLDPTITMSLLKLSNAIAWFYMTSAGEKKIPAFYDLVCEYKQARDDGQFPQLQCFAEDQPHQLKYVLFTLKDIPFSSVLWLQAMVNTVRDKMNRCYVETKESQEVQVLQPQQLHAAKTEAQARQEFIDRVPEILLENKNQSFLKYYSQIIGAHALSSEKLLEDLGSLEEAAEESRTGIFYRQPNGLISFGESLTDEITTGSVSFHWNEQEFYEFYDAVKHFCWEQKVKTVGALIQSLKNEQQQIVEKKEVEEEIIRKIIDLSQMQVALEAMRAFENETPGQKTVVDLFCALVPAYLQTSERQRLPGAWDALRFLQENYPNLLVAEVLSQLHGFKSKEFDPNVEEYYLHESLTITWQLPKNPQDTRSTWHIHFVIPPFLRGKALLASLEINGYETHYYCSAEESRRQFFSAVHINDTTRLQGIISNNENEKSEGTLSIGPLDKELISHRVTTSFGVEKFPKFPELPESRPQNLHEALEVIANSTVILEQLRRADSNEPFVSFYSRVHSERFVLTVNNGLPGINQTELAAISYLLGHQQEVAKNLLLKVSDVIEAMLVSVLVGQDHMVSEENPSQMILHLTLQTHKLLAQYFPEQCAAIAQRPLQVQWSTPEGVLHPSQQILPAFDDSRQQQVEQPQGYPVAVVTLDEAQTPDKSAVRSQEGIAESDTTPNSSELSDPEILEQLEEFAPALRAARSLNIRKIETLLDYLIAVKEMRDREYPYSSHPSADGSHTEPSFFNHPKTGKRTLLAEAFLGKNRFFREMVLMNSDRNELDRFIALVTEVKNRSLVSTYFPGRQTGSKAKAVK